MPLTAMCTAQSTSSCISSLHLFTGDFDVFWPAQATCSTNGGKIWHGVDHQCKDGDIRPQS